ncbi:ABC transporter permease [Microbulbifer halophilus]|uniref:ABC transporter permease n=1 Tax=Microbulbifer halophilus TaxID=453963 RepID=A0ABW5EGT9_9GAMM|nr:FtsX-like permease family protein [Microbulbifer halophilus]MCW8128557.1 FtsX-like permease family protein [Microbulbifer halophilus]
MKYLTLIWAALLRSKTRTVLTLMSVLAAFLLFGLLDSVRVAFNSGGSETNTNRLVVSSKLSITQMLPYSLLSRIESTPGVQETVYAAWFGGIYQDQKNFFPNFSVGPGYLDMYPEYVIDPAQVKAWNADRTGAIVGESLANKFGWKIGDTIPLQATIFPQRDGSNNWPLVLRGTFRLEDSKRKGEENQLIFHWKHFDEANLYVNGQVGWYIVKLDSMEQATGVAQAIDALSQNSSHETKTQTEQAFNQSFAKQFADVGLIVTGIMSAVFFTLLLLTGNTMAQTVRERIPELAVLKTLGFTNRAVLVLVLAESVLLILLGGVLGMLIANMIIPAFSSASGGIVALSSIPTQTWALGLALMTGIGLITGASPAMRAKRLNIVDALAGR